MDCFLPMPVINKMEKSCWGAESVVQDAGTTRAEKDTMYLRNFVYGLDGQCYNVNTDNYQRRSY